jgi:uncharacterized membrane protein (UPF0127 family)
MRQKTDRGKALCGLLLAAGGAFALACTRAGAEAEKSERSPAVVLPSGHRYPVEIAATPELRARGLMYRESLPDGRGMLFLFPKPSVEGFWMKNCNFPIDIVWLDEKRRVQFVSAHTPPCREEDCPTYGPKAPSLYVLEIPDGAAAKEKVAVASEIKLENIPELPKE